MANLNGWLPLLTKQRCRKAVVVALRKYDPSNYRTLKFNDLLFLRSHEDALAAVDLAVRKTGKPKFRTALRILEGPAVYETRGAKKKKKTRKSLPLD